MIIGESRFSGKSKDTPQQHEDLIITPKGETITEISAEVLTPIEEKKETEIREQEITPIRVSWKWKLVKLENDYC